MRYKKNDFPPGNNVIKMDNTKKNATVIYDVVSLRIKILSEDFPNSFAFSLIAFSPIVV